MTEQSLIQKANVLFPILPTTPERAVRHARRAWVHAMQTLQAIQYRQQSKGF